MFSIGYNRQYNNLGLGGKVTGWKQCFTTCAWMFLSHYDKSIDAKDDKGLSLYFDDVEDSVGKPGIAEKIKRKYRWITGNTSYWWLVQKAGIEKWGNMKVSFQESMDYELLGFYALKGPIILQTKKMGGLRGGHIILIISKTEEGFICHDPAGDATTRYRNKDGANKLYTHGFLKKYTGKRVRCIY